MINNRKLNKDKQFGDFVLRTRVRFYDEKIIKQELNDPYRIPKNPKIVIDCGGHIGVTSLMCAQRNALIYCFEPNGFNFEVLKYNVEINGFQDKIKCIQLGVGKPGETKLYLHPRNSGAISSYLDQKGLTSDNYEIVDFISIHDVFKNYNIDHCDLLKMDCEGSEVDIIRDLDEDLISRIDQISVEFHDKKVMKELIDKLSKWYQPENIHRYEWVFRNNYFSMTCDEIVSKYAKLGF